MMKAEAPSLSGCAPCICGYYLEDIPLLGYKEPDGNGGWNWRVEPGVRCSQCGEWLIWLHQPAPETLALPQHWLQHLNQTTLAERTA